MSRRQLSESDLEAVRSATRKAELETGGEVACVLVDHCDVYEGALWKAATAGALAGALAAAAWQILGPGWLRPQAALWVVLAAFAGAAAGYLAALGLPALRRALVSPEVLDRRAERRAAAAFLDEEIFDTRDRTGVLVFVALFEHRVRILADRGIHARVPGDVWETVSRDLARGIREGRTGPALVRAVEEVGRLLARHGVPRRADDVDELADEPRVLDD